MRGYRVPSLYRRYVVRARYLKSHRPFVAAMAVAAESWDSRFPEFRIGRRGFPPDKPYGLGSDYPHPALLSAAFERFNTRSAELSASDERAMHGAAFEWRLLVFELTHEWFPKRFFPTWRTPSLHPAAQFVGSCVLWRPESVSELAVKPFHLGVIGVPSDPANSDEHPQVIYYRSLLTIFANRLDLAASNGEALTHEVLRTAYSVAMDEAGRLATDASFDESKHFKYVPVFPGMTTTDWQAMEATVFGELARDKGNLLESHALSLERDGMSVQAIAGTLGVSRRTAARMLGR